MIVRVLVFASLRERLHSSSIEVTVSEPACVRDLLAAVREQHPKVAPLLGPCRVAVDQTFADLDQPISATSELAIVPPVSGGHDADTTPSPATRFYLGPAPLVADQVVAAVAGPATGGIVTFIGQVRDHSRGHTIAFLEYEAYPAMALKVMQEIAEAVALEVPGARVAIHHRLGHLEIGDAAVIIAAAAAHRAEAFTACRLAIERLKQDVPIWKTEQTTSGESWTVQGP